MPDNSPKLTLENVRLIYRNFSGRPGPFNQEGDRNFCAILPEDLAMKMKGDGWNIRQTKPRESEDEEETIPGEYYLPVKVGYNYRPPRITQITSVSKTDITEDIVGTLDWVDIVTTDITIAGSHWENPLPDGPTIKAYLRTMYITIDEDELDRKYATSNHPQEG
jgi:hypothetical protein